MCSRCGSSFSTNNCSCSSSSSCPVQLDFECVLYHKRNQGISGLTNLGLNNGTDLEVIIEAIDVKLGDLNVDSWALPYLRAVPYTIHTLKQFGEAVDEVLLGFSTDIATAVGNAAIGITAVDTQSIEWTVNGPNNHTITGNVRVSAFANNQLVTTQPDGLYAVPQTLDIDYENKLISISDGNSVDLTPLVTADGYLGNQTADPSTVVNGQTWYRTDTDEYKVKLNGSIRVITIT